MQVKLLRVLQDKTLMRVGGSEAVTVDVRLVAATNRRPEEAVAQGKLRQDLLYRLNVFPIQLPALRDRGDDVELLAQHFLAEMNKAHGTSKALTGACLARLRRHNWPGNVRELKNVLERAFILAEQDLGIDALPLGVQEESGASGLLMQVGTSVAEMEKRLILATLEHCQGDKKRAASVLQISLKTLYNRINQYASPWAEAARIDGSA
jgi:transcriptional regulator with PAS, ATPase and Fis domain